MAKTYHDRYVAALIARGWRIDATAQSKKYTVMVQEPGATGSMGKRVEDRDTRMFVGRSGAVRYGKTVTNSLSMSDATKQRLLTTLPEPAVEKAS